MPDALRLALTLFTVAPLPPGRTDRATARRAMALSPAVGVLLVLIVGAGLFLARQVYLGEFLGSLLSSAMALAALAALTRGMHLDGLVDTADGFAAYTGRARALEIMRSPEVGALGAAALVLNLLLQVTALTQCVYLHRGTSSLLIAVLAGRLSVLWACTPGIPAARSDGMGALVAGSVPRTVAAAWTVAAFVGVAFYGRFDYDGGSERALVRGVVGLALGLIAGWLLRRHALRRFGGITGDVLGALIEVAATASLLVMASSVPFQRH